MRPGRGPGGVGAAAGVRGGAGRGVGGDAGRWCPGVWEDEASEAPGPQGARSGAVAGRAREALAHSGSRLSSGTGLLCCSHLCAAPAPGAPVPPDQRSVPRRWGRPRLSPATREGHGSSRRSPHLTVSHPLVTHPAAGSGGPVCSQVSAPLSFYFKTTPGNLCTGRCAIHV